MRPLSIITVIFVVFTILAADARGSSRLSAAGKLPTKSTRRRLPSMSDDGLLPRKQSMSAKLGLGSNVRAFFRDFKRVFSSGLESLILQLTRPDNNPVSMSAVEELISDMSGAELEYPLATLSKLSRKLFERDVRTKIKALQVLHILSQRLDTQFPVAFQFLRGVTDNKVSGFYLDMTQALAPAAAHVTSTEEAWLLKFAQMYGEYFGQRMRMSFLRNREKSVQLELLEPLVALVTRMEDSARSANNPLIEQCLLSLRKDMAQDRAVVESVAKSKSKHAEEATVLLRKYARWVPKDSSSSQLPSMKATRRLSRRISKPHSRRQQ